MYILRCFLPHSHGLDVNDSVVPYRMVLVVHTADSPWDIQELAEPEDSPAKTSKTFALHSLPTTASFHTPQQPKKQKKAVAISEGTSPLVKVGFTAAVETKSGPRNVEFQSIKTSCKCIFPGCKQQFSLGPNGKPHHAISPQWQCTTGSCTMLSTSTSTHNATNAKTSSARGACSRPAQHLCT